ncbi:MAG: type II toxin-antitoxin system VapC family toxin [Spirochaetaceae bacterium]|nr:type II toxin-antitoxin system VapC family toxin [Spirochaetaceae bacterium]
MRVVIDTNRYRDFCDGKDDAVVIVRKSSEIHIPLIVVAELRAGFACGNKGPENEQILSRFLNKERVKLLSADEGTTFIYANLFRQLRTQGTAIPTNDLWIAALTIQHGLLLFSRDTHFNRLPQIPIV